MTTVEQETLPVSQMRRARVSAALRAIEEGTRLDDLTDDEIDTIIDAARNHRADHEPRVVEVGLREAAQFLSDRLDDLEWMDGELESTLRDYMGHVDPAHARLKSALAAQSPAPTEGEVERPSDEALEPHLPESLRAEKRIGIRRSDWLTGWFVPWSPRNDNQNAEGPWSHWVSLANAILAADAKAQVALAARPSTQPQADAGSLGEGA